MLNRRHVLLGAGSFLISQGLSSCASRDRPLSIYLLQGSIPPKFVKKFQATFPGSQQIRFQPVQQLSIIPELLANWQSSLNSRANAPTDLVTLGDYWLGEAIAKQWIQPLAAHQLPNWSQIPPAWQNLVQRKGNFWGCPYRLGSTLIVYRQDKFKNLNWTPRDWGDLWREEIAGRFSLLDQGREVIGLTLKYLGHSYNTENPQALAELAPTLAKLHQQVKFYSSQDYLQPLILGDTWLAVGWSDDILPPVARDPKLKVVIPRSGTSLWSDLWVQPFGAQKPSNLLREWLNFAWQPEGARLISLESNGLSPVLLSPQTEPLPERLAEDPHLSNRESLDKSEFLLPLSPASQAQYEKLWREMRGVSRAKI
jgi:putative spermidine/putrescine transport system substrate-binding protein